MSRFGASCSATPVSHTVLSWAVRIGDDGLFKRSVAIKSSFFCTVVICAEFLAGCAAHVPILDEPSTVASQGVHEAQGDDGLDPMVEHPADGEPTGAVTQEKNPKARARKSAATSSKVVRKDLREPAKEPAQGTAKASTQGSAQEPDIANAREQARQKAEDERKERHLKQVIEGICRGC